MPTRPIFKNKTVSDCFWNFICFSRFWFGVVSKLTITLMLDIFFRGVNIPRKYFQTKLNETKICIIHEVESVITNVQLLIFVVKNKVNMTQMLAKVKTNKAIVETWLNWQIYGWWGIMSLSNYRIVKETLILQNIYFVVVIWNTLMEDFKHLFNIHQS